jgi:hypothetical protein
VARLAGTLGCTQRLGALLPTTWCGRRPIMLLDGRLASPRRATCPDCLAAQELEWQRVREEARRRGWP